MDSLTNHIQKTKNIPIRELWLRLGLPELPERGNICSPFRNDKNPTCSVGGKKNTFHDFGTGETLDGIALVRRVKQCDFREAVEFITDEKLTENGNGQYPAAVAAQLTHDPLEQLVELRGWKASAMRALGAKSKGNCVRWPMRNQSGAITGWQLRRGDNNPFESGAKSICERGAKLGLYFINPLRDGDKIVLVGSPTNAIAAISAGWHCTIGTAGSNPGKIARDALKVLCAGRQVVIVRDIDPAGEKWRDKVIGLLCDSAAAIFTYELQAGDVDDFLKATADPGAAIMRVIMDAQRVDTHRIKVEAEAKTRKTEFALAKGADNLGAKVFPRTDTGVSERVAAQHGANLRYVKAWNEFIYFDGKRWRTNDTLQVERIIKQTVRRLIDEAKGLEDDKYSAALKFAATYDAASRRAAVQELLKCEVAVLPEQFDSNATAYLYNVNNGTIELKTGELLAHDREHYITKISPIDYNHGADCPKWKKFLHEVFAGNAELIQFVKRAIGYSLIGCIRDRALFVLHGRGRNGKTILLEVIRLLHGVYGISTSIKTFMENKYSNSTNELARLAGRRYVSASESGENMSFDPALIKLITGGDTITARHLYQNSFDFRPQFKCFIRTNDRPSIPSGGDSAFWDRMILIPFAVQFLGSIPQQQMIDDLCTELPGIMTWAVAGCLEYLRDGLNPPEIVRAAVDDYRTEQDRLAEFWIDCVIDDPQGRIEKGSLFDKYRHWAAQKQILRPYGKTNFGRFVSNHPGVSDYKSSGVWQWKGITQR